MVGDVLFLYLVYRSPTGDLRDPVDIVDSGRREMRRAISLDIRERELKRSELVLMSVYRRRRSPSMRLQSHEAILPFCQSLPPLDYPRHNRLSSLHRDKITAQSAAALETDLFASQKNCFDRVHGVRIVRGKVEHFEEGRGELKYLLDY